jgi:3-methyladenine DNA glycosylase AlkD
MSRSCERAQLRPDGKTGPAAEKRTRLQHILEELSAAADPRIAAVSRRFFKTGPGEYGEGDLFRGIRVPVLRKLARKHRDIGRSDADQLLHSPYHEDRLLALFLLMGLFSKGSDSEREKIYDLYLKRTRFINNWDLVDASAEHIVGAFLRGRLKDPLCQMADSGHLWTRRAAIMATFHYIKRGEFKETLKIARQLLGDPEGLIHKAVGWMLREVGKRDPETEEAFLRTHGRRMPRTMLRYAIERFPEKKRQGYLKGTPGDHIVEAQLPCGDGDLVSGG